MNAERRYFLTRYLCIIGTVLCGSGSTIIAKRLDSINFYFPLFQTGLMFLGMSICCGLTLLFSKKNEHLKLIQSSSEQKETKNCIEKIGKFAFCVTAIFDFLGSFMEYFSYNLLKASSIVTFKMMVIVFIVLYRVIIMKKTIYRHQKLGLTFLGMGFLIVGSEVCFNSDNQIDWNSTAGIGITLMIIAQIFNSSVIVLQEYQMNQIPITPQEAVLIQGVSGLIFCTIVYAPLHYLFRNFKSNITDISEPSIKLTNSTEILLLILFFLVVVGFLNFFQVKTIKISDSLSLCTIDSGRVILVWILSIAFSFETALPVEIIGGGCLIFGILIYNEVVVIPCCGLKKSAKASMKENEIYRELKIKDRQWQMNLDSILK
jgi:drug/metabolite transporter (DMT)-like permease